MNCKDVVALLHERWNPSYAMDWDNVGLLVGRYEKEIKKIFVALDVTEANLEQAFAFGADLIVTHHPMIFSPVKKINTQDFMGRRLISMIQHDLCYFAMHTNFDVKSMAMLNEHALGLLEASPLQTTVLGENEEGLGRIGILNEEMTLEAFACKVKEDLQVPDVRVYGNLQDKVSKVAVCGGSGKSTLKDALKKEAQVLVTGDIDYHTGIDAAAQGLWIVDAGHYGTEYCFIQYVTKELEKMFPEMEICAAKISPPYQVL